MSDRVMIIEDDPFIALDMQDVVESAGYGVIGPIASRDKALEIIDTDTPDCALLDFNVRGGTTAMVARRLETLGVPYMFVTGNSRDVEAALPELDALIRCKPVAAKRIIGDLQSLLR